MSRRIAVLIGSDSDLPQCKEGLEFLQSMKDKGEVGVEVLTASIHRNTDFVLNFLKETNNRIDVIIAGAGMANHLTGMCDTYLRYNLRNTRTVVVGVAFGSNNPEDVWAAKLSITRVPGTQVVFDGHTGSEGFLRACAFAAVGVLPKITLKEPKPTKNRTLQEAIVEASKREV